MNFNDSILTVRQYKRDVKVNFSNLTPLSSAAYRNKKYTTRSSIVKYTERSAKRLRHILRNSEDIWKTMIDLTYPANFPYNGRKIKEHLNTFLQWLRRKNIKYVWVLEFQERGAPHYHIVVNADFVDKNELSERWYKIVGSGDEKHLRAGTRINAIRSKKGISGYLVSYFKKYNQKTPPEGFENVGRFWGNSRNLLVYETYQKVGHFFKLVWHIKLLRNWYKAHLRKFGIKWKWKGKGFTALDGIRLINQLLSLKC